MTYLKLLSFIMQNEGLLNNGIIDDLLKRIAKEIDDFCFDNDLDCNEFREYYENNKSYFINVLCKKLKDDYKNYLTKKELLLILEGILDKNCKILEAEEKTIDYKTNLVSIILKSMFNKSNLSMEQFMEEIKLPVNREKIIDTIVKEQNIDDFEINIAYNNAIERLK